MPTIYEIAAKVGVSSATVSRALNEKGYVRTELRDRILAVARELDYHPNSLARSLITKKTNVIGLILPDISNPFFPALARGVEDVAHRQGYNVILCNADANARKEAEYLRLLRSRQVDGVIFTTSHSRKSLEKLYDLGMPMVMADRTVRLDCDLVVVDNIDGAMQVTRHLLSLGHSEIGLITGPRGVTTGAERYEGYRQAMAERGLKCRFDLIREGDYRQQSGYEHAKEFLKLKNPPTAIFACNDLMAIGAMDALEEEGLRVPDDVAVVGYDDTLLASTVRPRLTTVAQPKYEIGAIAAEMLINRIASRDIPVRQVVLKPQLIIRDTSVVKAGTPRSQTFLCGGGL